jgi:hypothetical protein
VRFVRVIDTPVILSHNRRTRDEHGNTCVQEGLHLGRLIMARSRLVVATTLHK